MENNLLLEKRKKTEMILMNVYNLPSVSGMMLEISRMLDDPSTNTATISKIIGKDPGLTTKILSISNSPLYGLPRRVSTIDFAILIIGYQDIKNIIIALSMIESFKNKGDKNMNTEEFWKHALITGNASKRIAEDLGYRFGGEAFVGGLLHDLGIPVIHKYMHKEFMEIVRIVKEQGRSFEEVEQETMGMTHEEIAEFLVKKWNLPENLCSTIINHHKPGKLTENRELASVIHLADYMTQKLGVGNFYWDDTMVLDESMLETLNFKSMEDLEQFMEGYKELFLSEIKSIRL